MGASAAARGVRDYDRIVQELHVTGDLGTRMVGVIDLLWDRLSGTGVSWVGFYTRVGGSDQMVLGARRDKPACSPIGLHGVCGQSLTSRKSLVVTDVAKLGAGYIACDPRDRAEVVVPLLDRDGVCWGVLDVDSWDVNAFGVADAVGLCRVLRFAGVSEMDPLGVEVV
jgi:putative methionine-R-sulfoxide reductase with GAF domain